MILRIGLDLPVFRQIFIGKKKDLYLNATYCLALERKAFTMDDFVAVVLQVVDETIAKVVSGIIAFTLAEKLQHFGNTFSETLLVLFQIVAALLHASCDLARF